MNLDENYIKKIFKEMIGHNDKNYDHKKFLEMSKNDIVVQQIYKKYLIKKINERLRNIYYFRKYNNFMGE